MLLVPALLLCAAFVGAVVAVRALRVLVEA